MPPTPSPTYERLREYITKRISMSHVYQPLMLMERLGRGSARHQPAQPPRRTLPGGSCGRT
jgi:ATP adenylyltransferase